MRKPHQKFVMITLLLALFSQSLVAAALPGLMHDEHARHTASEVIVSKVTGSDVDHSMHGMTDPSDDGRITASQPDDCCKFECDWGGCFNFVQLTSDVRFKQPLSSRGKLSQSSQIAQSQPTSPLYRPPIAR